MNSRPSDCYYEKNRERTLSSMATGGHTTSCTSTSNTAWKQLQLKDFVQGKDPQKNELREIHHFL